MFCVTRTIKFSLLLPINMKLGVLCWCLICLFDRSGDGLVIDSLSSLCAVSVVSAVLNVCVCVFSDLLDFLQLGFW